MPLPYPPKAPESAIIATTPQTLILPNAPIPTLADPSQLFPNATFSSQPTPIAPQELPSDPSTTAYRPATLNLTLLTDLSTIEPNMPSAAAASTPSPDELSVARQLAMWAETPQLPTATGAGMILPDLPPASALPRATLPATTSYGYYQPPLVGATTTFHGLWQCQPPILNTMTCTPSAPIMSLLPPAFPPSRGMQQAPVNNGIQGSGPAQTYVSGQGQEYFTQHSITKEQNNSPIHKGLIKPESRDDPSPGSDEAPDEVVLMNLDTGNLVRDRQPANRLECEQCPFGAADEMALRMHYAQNHYVQDHNRVKEAIMKYSP